MKQKRSKLLVYALPVIVVLSGLTAYQYGYVNARKELVSLREMNILRTKTLERCMEMIASKPNLEKKLEAVKEKRKATNSKIIEGQTASLCAATLQESVKAIITGRGGSITSERVEKEEKNGKFRIVNVTMDAILPDTRALTDILFGIETRTPYVVAKEVDLRVRNFREPRELMVKFRLSAVATGE